MPVVSTVVSLLSWAATQCIALLVALTTVLLGLTTRKTEKLFTFTPMLSFYNKHIAPTNTRLFVGNRGSKASVQTDLIEPLLRSTLSRPLHILVTNCGPACEAVALAEQLGQERAKIIATDISEPMLGAALVNTSRTHTQNMITVQLADACALPFEDNEFDGVLSIGGLKYFPDATKALQEMTRVVKPNGGRVLAFELLREGATEARAWYSTIQEGFGVRYKWILSFLLPLMASTLLPYESTAKTWIACLNDTSVAGRKFRDVCSCEYARMDIPFFKVLIVKNVSVVHS